MWGAVGSACSSSPKQAENNGNAWQVCCTFGCTPSVARRMRAVVLEQ
jgi:hypothetical protein